MVQDTIILDGRALALQRNHLLKKKLHKLPYKLGLSTILVGDDSASQVYVNAKNRACEEIGIKTYPFFLDEGCTEQELLNVINNLNSDPNIHGILVQLPLPKHINTNNILMAINPDKDVDGFHPLNMGKLFSNISSFAPATSVGIISLLELIGDKKYLEGRKTLIIGASNIVGKPTAALLLQKNATVTIAHKYTSNLKQLCLESELIISAVGKPNLITTDMISYGSVLIDVGINKIPNSSPKGYYLAGDIDFENVKHKASAITPVPGGVGPMTISSLMHNLYVLATQTSL